MGSSKALLFAGVQPSVTRRIDAHLLGEDESMYHKSATVATKEAAGQVKPRERRPPAPLSKETLQRINEVVRSKSRPSPANSAKDEADCSS